MRRDDYTNFGVKFSLLFLQCLIAFNVAKVGMKLFWNAHSIPNHGVPNLLQQ